MVVMIISLKIKNEIILYAVNVLKFRTLFLFTVHTLLDCFFLVCTVCVGLLGSQLVFEILKCLLLLN